MSTSKIDAMGHASHGVHMVESAFTHSDSEFDAFSKGAVGTAASMVALAPIVAFSLPVIAATSVVVGVAALFKKLSD